MRRFALLVMLALVPLACNRGKAPVVVDGPKSPPGWEVRYNAAVALARRGSDKALDDRVRETLLEMLDEQQQMRNFRRPTTDGKEISDANGAYLTLIATMHALNELHQRQPGIDLTPFMSAIDKLAQNPNLAVSTEAKKTQQLLTKS